MYLHYLHILTVKSHIEIRLAKLNLSNTNYKIFFEIEPLSDGSEKLNIIINYLEKFGGYVP